MLYRHRFRLQSATESIDTHGDPVKTWADYAVVYGEAKPLLGRERVDTMSVAPEVSWKLRIRYRAGVEPEHRVIFDGRELNVISVIDVEGKKRELELQCGEAA